MEHTGLVVNGAAVVLAFALILSLRSAAVRRAWVHLGRWGWAHLQPPEEVDPLVLELYAIDRRARLRADLERVRRLVATDTWMSATRQLGNRLACRRLEADLRAALRDEVLDEGRWAATGRAWTVQPAPVTLSGGVELLDVGGRRSSR